MSYGYIWLTFELYFNQNNILNKITSPKHLNNPKCFPKILKLSKSKEQSCNKLIKLP